MTALFTRLITIKLVRPGLTTQNIHSAHENSKRNGHYLTQIEIHDVNFDLFPTSEPSETISNRFRMMLLP